MPSGYPTLPWEKCWRCGRTTVLVQDSEWEEPLPARFRHSRTGANPCYKCLQKMKGRG